VKSVIREAVELHGSDELKSKSDGILADMDKLGQQLGGPPLAQALAESLCATCGKKVDASADFADELSRAEWRISRMCQACQDLAFAEPDEDEDDDCGGISW